MFQSILIYGGLFGSCFLLGKYAEKRSWKGGGVLIAFLLALVAGLRAESVGKDTDEYVKVFNSINHIKTDGYIVDVEESFRWICEVLLSIWNNYNFVLFVFAFITNLCVMVRLWDLKESISFPWALLCYILAYYLLSLNIMRQMCAVAIVFFATRYLKSGRYIIFSILVFLAQLFHSSALLGYGYLLVEIFFWKRLSEKQKIILIILLLGVIGGILLGLFQEQILQYAHYFEQQKEYEKLGLYLVVKFLFFVVTTFFIVKASKREAIIVPSQVYYFIGFILSSIGFIYPYMNRIGLYFMVYECVFMGALAKYTRESLMFKIAIFLLLGAAFMVSFLQNGNGCVPYVFYWQ